MVSVDEASRSDSQEGAQLKRDLADARRENQALRERERQARD